MRKFQIPKTVTLMGHKITVKFDDGFYDKHGVLGMSYPDNNEIVLQSPIQGRVSQDVINQTYLHELQHFKFYVLGYKDLYRDEQLVDQLSQLDYQAFHSAEYK